MITRKSAVAEKADRTALYGIAPRSAADRDYGRSANFKFFKILGWGI